MKNVNLGIELEYKFRQKPYISIDEFNIQKDDRTNFCFAAILKEAAKYRNLTDLEFMILYNSKQNSAN